MASPAENEAVYKWLDTHGGTGRWQKNLWRSVKGELVPCANGLHLCREKDLVQWIAPSLWIAEYDGEMVDADDKIVVRRARVVERLDGWNERTARLFAADCAERVLPIFEKHRPGDDRPRLAIQAARDFVDGLITPVALGAARVAARRAAWHARVAGLAAGRAAAWAAERPAWLAAADAAWHARCAGLAEAEEWQVSRLLDYAYGRLS